jgi:hypothetical protein
MKVCLPIALLLSTLVVNTAYAQSLPAGWATSDIGSVGAAGAGSGDGSSFTVSGAGADIWGASDAFRYAYTTLTGDGSIVAQVTSVQYVADWTKAGVMMRETLAPGSTHALMLVSANKGLAFQRRAATNGLSTNTSGGTGKAPYFVRLRRSGSSFEAARSTDGVTWTVVGSQTIAMASTIYVGIAVSSHVAGTLATATFASTTLTGTIGPASDTTETVVIMRHGEKPAGGYGQITCQGLQRALALPNVLTPQFGVPQAIFAPDPFEKVTDSAGSFYYVRPLATIEPTAIRLGLPVNTRYGYADIKSLQSALADPIYADATIYVAWEHVYLQQLVQNLMNAYGGGATVPSWPNSDYDSVYVVRLTYSNGIIINAQFTHDYEGLNNLSTTCPN